MARPSRAPARLFSVFTSIMYIADSESSVLEKVRPGSNKHRLVLILDILRSAELCVMLHIVFVGIA